MPTNMAVFQYVQAEIKSRAAAADMANTGCAAVMREDYPILAYMGTAELERFAEELADLPAKAKWQPPYVPPEATPADLPPGPYSYETIGPKTKSLGNGHVYILDANGRKIASMWGKPAEKLALAELIVNARGE